MLWIYRIFILILIFICFITVIVLFIIYSTRNNTNEIPKDAEIFFQIGMNKSGTSSLTELVNKEIGSKSALHWGSVVPYYRVALHIKKNIKKGLPPLCGIKKSYVYFSDMEDKDSCVFLYKDYDIISHLKNYYPNSKYILNFRDKEEKFLKSRFNHKNNHKYIKQWAICHSIDPSNLYQIKEAMRIDQKEHIIKIKKLFENESHRLFIYNIDKDNPNEFRKFLKLKESIEELPRANVNKSLKKTFNNEDKITLIILNYIRPHNLVKSVPIMESFDVIDQIIIANGHPDYRTEIKPTSKIDIFDDFDDNILLGGARRFKFVYRSRNDIILFLDDDIYPKENYIHKLLESIKKDPMNIAGNFKRTCIEKGYYMRTAKKYNSILTPILMTSKSLIMSYMEDPQGFNKYRDWLVKYHGNCEDLSLNIFIRERYNKNPIRVKSKDFIILDESDGYSSNKDHLTIRGEFCKKYSKM